MSKFIRLDQAITDGSAPFISITPGAAGYSDRYLAARLPGASGSALTLWGPSDAGVGSNLVVPAGNPGGFVMDENGRRYVHTDLPGRLLGVHKNTQPFTVAAIIRAPTVGVTGIVGCEGVAVSRAAGGNYTAAGGVVLDSAVSTNGWVLAMFQLSAGTLRLRINGTEVSAATALTPPGSFGGLYFGPSAGGSADAQEIVYWPTALTLAQRDAVHAYAKSQYPGVG